MLKKKRIFGKMYMDKYSNTYILKENLNKKKITG